MKFTLEIELGNDAMQTYGDIAKALTHVKTKLAFDSERGINAKANRVDGAKIMDVNGNTVGSWEVTN